MANLIFIYGFDERKEDEANARGYVNHVLVQIRSGNKYPVVFYDLVRLGQDLDEECKLGNRFVADPGMIVLEYITLKTMQAAVDRLEEEGFFAKFLPINE